MSLRGAVRDIRRRFRSPLEDDAMPRAPDVIFSARSAHRGPFARDKGGSATPLLSIDAAIYLEEPNSRCQSRLDAKPSTFMMSWSHPRHDTNRNTLHSLEKGRRIILGRSLDVRIDIILSRS